MSGVEGLRSAFASFVSKIQQVPVSWETGTCCCGSPMEGHSIADNHSPVDEGSYFIGNAIRDALSAIEGGGGALQPSASVPTEQADGGVLDRDWLVKIIREHSFAQDAADMIIGAMRSATPPATPIAGGDRGKMAHIIGRAITSYEDDPSPDCTTAKQNAVSKATDAILELIVAARRDDGAGQ